VIAQAQLLERFESVRRLRDGDWLVTCPAHDDRKPSLHVTRGRHRWLLKCQAGCELGDVLERAGLTWADLFEDSNGHREIEAIYRYEDEQGRPLFEVVRLEGKQFRQRRPDGSWGLGDTRRVLYRLPRVLEAIEKGEVVWVVEGEKDVDALEELELVATCNPMGAGKWRDDYSQALRGATVTIVADADKPGRDHARQVAGSLRGVATQVEVVEPAAGNDLSGHLAAGKALDELVPAGIAEPEPGPEPESGDTKDEKRSQATKLVELASCSDVDLFRTSDSTPYATVSAGGHRETHRLRSRGFRGWLIRQLWEAERKAPGSQAIQDALGVLEGMALYDGDERPVFVRLAEHGGAIYLDLGDETWQVVEITPTGWQIISDPPVRFRRPPGLSALPRPERGGSIAELRRFLNPGITDGEFVLTVSWLVATFRPTGPYPALHLAGEHGTAKSSEARVLRELVDPNASELRAEPRSGHDLMIAATNAWLIAFDNLSHIPPWLSDALCRLATGGGFSTRMLYTDDEERIFDAQRPILFTGIEEVATRADLLDRLIIRQLPVIPKHKRIAEEEFWTAWEAARPRILGALLDAVACALRRLPEVELAEHPRMADFCRWAVAAVPAFGWDAETFTAAYDANRDCANDLALESALISEPLRQLAEDGGFEGSLAELLDRLEGLVDDEITRRKGWPTSGRALAGHLRRMAPNLRAAGIEISLDRKDPVTRRRVIEVQKTARQHPSGPSDPSPRHASPKGRAESTKGCEGSSKGCHGAQDPLATHESKDPKGTKADSQPSSNGHPGPSGEIDRDDDPDLAARADAIQERSDQEGWS
jgi:hypothetical protein